MTNVRPLVQREIVKSPIYSKNVADVEYIIVQLCFLFRVLWRSGWKLKFPGLYVLLHISVSDMV